MSVASLFESVLNWLRGGYPEGVPGPDRVPLLALLRETPLSEDEIRRVVRAITAPDSEALADGQITTDEIEGFVADVAGRAVEPSELRRVAAKLAAGGWPLAGTEAEQ